MRKNNHYDQTSDKVYIEISANTNTLNSEMIIKNNCEVDFRQYNSINSLLGFDVNSTHQDLMSLKIWLIFLQSQHTSQY